MLLVTANPSIGAKYPVKIQGQNFIYTPRGMAMAIITLANHNRDRRFSLIVPKGPDPNEGNARAKG